MESFVSDNCCYGSDPVKEGVITNMEPCNTFRVSPCSSSKRILGVRRHDDPALTVLSLTEIAAASEKMWNFVIYVKND